MTTILVYGSDGTGKSIQCKSIAEMAESAIVLSFATKNRKLYETSGVECIECLKFNDDANVNPYKTMDEFQNQCNKIIKENVVKLVVIDEITLLRKWAQYVILEEENRKRRGTDKPLLTKIGKDNAAAWGRVNDIVYGALERLANWAVINDVTIIAITSLVEERKLVTKSDGETTSETTGKFVVDAKENVRKLADVRVKLEKDGSKGKGYYVIWEKSQDWMKEGPDACKVDKQGLMTELMKRGVLE
jgi:broad-specificity NMP kinase